MSHFYGTLQGNRGEATRQGSKKSGIETSTASWEGAIHTRAFYNEETGNDWVRVTLGQWMGRGQSPSKILYYGPIGEYNPQ